MCWCVRACALVLRPSNAARDPASLLRPHFHLSHTPTLFPVSRSPQQLPLPAYSFPRPSSAHLRSAFTGLLGTAASSSRAQSPLLPCGFTSRTTFARLLLTILCRLRIRFGKYLSLSRSPDLTYGARKAFFRVSHSGASSFSSSSKQQAAAASRVTAERASILIASLAVSSSPTTPNTHTHTHTHQPLCHITPSPCALEFDHANRPRCTIRHADSTTSARTRLRHHFHDRTLPTPIQHELPTSRRRCPAAAAAWPRAGRLPAAGRFRAERLWRRTGPRTTARPSNGSAYGPIATGSIPATAGPARTAGPSRSQPGWRSEDNPLVSSAARHTVEHTNRRQDGRTRALDRRELRPQRVVWNGLSG